MTNEDIQIILKQFSKYFQESLKFDCFFKNQNCDSGSIRSHTLQNNGVLSKIEKNGHLIKIENHGGEKGINFTKIGRKDASTFTGLCAYHDNEIFGPIDLDKNQKFNVNDQTKLCLLGFRGALKEFLAKKGVLESFERLIYIIKNKSQEQLEEVAPITKKFKNGIQWNKFNIEPLEGTLIGNYMGVREVSPFITHLKTAVDDKNFSNFTNDVFIFPNEINWACSSLITPNNYFDNSLTVNNYTEYEKNGFMCHRYLGRYFNASYKKISEKMSESVWHAMTINVFPNFNRTIVVFTYSKNDKSIFEPFTEFLLNKSQEKQESYISQLVISTVENILFDPDAILSLKDNVKNKLLKLWKNSLFEDNKYIENGINIFRLDKIEL